MTDPLAPDIAHLPPQRRPRSPHTLGDAIHVPPEISVTGFEQKEKTCKVCGAIRVTVLADEHTRREWRLMATGGQWAMEQDPPCLGNVGAAP